MDGMKEKLENLGGNYWAKYGKERMYFDRAILMKLYGFEWETYKSGNVSSATLNGEEISNNKFNKYLDSMPDNLYYDFENDRFAWDIGPCLYPEIAKEVVKKIRSMI